MSEFHLTCAPGLESLLAEEISELTGLPQSSLRTGLGLVSFELKESQVAQGLAQIMAFSRIGSRLLLPIKIFSSANLAMLYDQVRRIPWPDIFDNSQTFAVFSHGNLGVPGIAASILPLKIKDAICDEFRKKGFDRPDVDRKNPDIRIEAHFTKKRCELSLELNPYPLHRRGYRLEGAGGEAPLREDKAAALIRFAGLRSGEQWVDAFCGSGTLAIEAAIKEMKIPNGIVGTQDFKRSTLVQRYPAVITEIGKIKNLPKISWKGPQIAAIDISDKALKTAKENAKRAGVFEAIRFEKKDVTELEGADLQIVGNPPYGERLGDIQKSGELISQFTRHIKHHVCPCELTLVLPKGELEAAPGFKPSRKLDFENATLPSRFLKYKIFPGSKKPTQK